MLMNLPPSLSQNLKLRSVDDDDYEDDDHEKEEEDENVDEPAAKPETEPESEPEPVDLSCDKGS